ncbi:mannitol-1-phosphate 5-dehydrogenase [Halobacillus andaensis]|uniref:Mannitol-1-phosphate 5-dehydrogenase n=1 Tax=Halobacillus andaensis TaxID=1176239 RepID=A0A917B5J0_HALAA|nr:mannitol-1-phosphate 5-dehydrogenase [Halobacillus andaensis]MBP2006127.1 mannitol-1-phosphate 5-dehydrogenase [Halobacillus andaensis]GGF23444.1 mannitol-1-phosphate 5-dehydrogenase [Halobacillus andaensis]
MKAIHFGAGNIGRGFIGMLLDQSGYETIFVDVNDQVIEALNREKSYDVRLAGADQVVNVKNVSGINSKYDEDDIIKLITEADLITTAVGANILPIVAPVISKGLQRRLETNKTPLNIIACENMIGGSSELMEHVYKHLRQGEQRDCDRLYGFPNAAVDRIVPDQKHENPLTVEVEPFYEWVVETKDIKGEQPNVTGITYVEDLTPYIERKLFTVNTGHAAAAYLGRQHGLETIKEAMDDETVVEKVRGTLSETGAVLIEKYQFKREDHEAYTNKIIERFKNPSISDEVTRVGRGPKRKLGPKDRLIRPSVEYVDLIQKEPVYLSGVIAAALQFNDPNDEESRELQQSIKDKGEIPTLLQVSELPENHPVVKLVEQHFNH